MNGIYDEVATGADTWAARPWTWLGAPHTAALHLVTPRELEDLRDAITHSRVPIDLQVKLAALAGTGLLHHFVEQNSRLFLALLMAAKDGGFRRGSLAERERLLRVLAYVRKNDDAIADHRSDGYTDDHQEVRAVALDLAPLLQEFKLWRLRHEVPRLWLDEAHGSACGRTRLPRRGLRPLTRR
jgi:hypothetical protein